MSIQDDARAALQCLDPSVAREVWLKIAFAVKDALGPEGEEDFLAWSSGAGNYDVVDARTTYRNAKPKAGGVTVATLWMLAGEAGFKRGGNGSAGVARVVPIAQARAPTKPPTPPTDPEPVWNDAHAVDVHPYLDRKGIKAHGTRTDRARRLLVPFYNEARVLQTLQRIWIENGETIKRFLPGAPQAGSVAILGEPEHAAVVGIAEGFATAATIHEASGYPVIAAGSRGTLPRAAKIARAWAPGARLVICADRGDLTTPIAAARAVGGLLALPGPETSPDGFDFNDWKKAKASDAEIRARLDFAQALPAETFADESGRDRFGQPNYGHDEPPPADAVVVASDPGPLDAQAPGGLPVPFVLSPKGKVLPSLANVTAYLASGALGAFSFDTFTGLALWKGAPVLEAQIAEVCIDVQRSARIGRASIFHNAGVATVADAIVQASRSDSFNSCERWLEGLPAWDGVERIAHFFVDVCGTEQSDYIAACGRYVWLALVSRMVRPGCKADMAPVLIGPQGVGKSTLGQIIGGERYGEAGLTDAGTKDWCLALRGKILVELSELSGHSRAEIETIKAVISRQVDDYRSPYARTTEAHPRGFIFIATTNEQDFLSDASGNRRWLPIQTQGPIALDAARAMRAQYFAEAFDLVRSNKAGEFWMVPGAFDVQDKHLARDPWVDLLGDKLASLTGAMPERIDNVAIYSALGIPAERQSGGGTGRRVASAMRSLGYRAHRWGTPDGRAVRGFVRVDEAAA